MVRSSGLLSGFVVKVTPNRLLQNESLSRWNYGCLDPLAIYLDLEDWWHKSLCCKHISIDLGRLAPEYH